MATSTAAEQIPANVSLPEWQQWYGRNVGKTMLVNGQSVTIGTDVSPDQLLNAFRSNNIGWSPATQGPQAPPAPTDTTQPETRALGQMAQIDPASEALRQGLASSYLAPLQQAAQTGPPPAADVQSYLNLYKQIDPQGYAQRVALAGGMDQFVQQAQQQAALGSTLDASTQREVEQATRAGQVARGNVYGTPQLVAEAMARGSAGEARAQQRRAALSSALGQQQGYLGSGQGIGDVANALYQQGFSRNIAGRQAAQGGALSYLGSGQTPYQAGASYLNMAQQNAAQAAQGGPQYNPSSLGQQYQAQQFPQYGLDMSQLAGNWYNNINQANMQAYGLGQAYGGQGASGGNRAMSAGVGALGGAASGALAGSAVPGIGTLVGAGIGAVAGGASGYFK